MAYTKQELKTRRHWRIRQRVKGTSQRPRMSVRFSGRNIHVQFVDDTRGVTLAAASTVEEGFRKENPRRSFANLPMATILGKMAAERALQKQIKTVIFDRGGSLYHGKIKVLADAARAAGLQF